MRVLLSTIGSRGDVQPLVALALHLTGLGHEAHLCVPPDFRDWIESLGLTVTPIGPEVRRFAAARPMGSAARVAPTLEQRRQMAEATVSTQFETIRGAARGCAAIVAATALQIAARSVSELMNIPYVFVAYAPTVLPSPHHPPPVLPSLPGEAPPPAADTRELWTRDAERFNSLFGAALNAHRAALGLGRVEDTRAHVFSERPWLAADPLLGPWPDPSDQQVVQTGAWILEDEHSLAPQLDAFLRSGEPPIYFGLGSTRAPDGAGQAMLDAARALGRRAIVSQGWFETPLVDSGSDCYAIGDVNVLARFPRVAAVVHHGGAGTTTAAALGGVPQVVIPSHYDQPYWAGRVEALGIGVAHPAEAPSSASLIGALERALTPDVMVRAKATAAAVRRDGVAVAARRLETLMMPR